MSADNFVKNLQERLSIINSMIPAAKSVERRKLQKERSDLEDKIRRVST